MRILLAVDGSAPSQEAIHEVAERSGPASSVARVISVVRPYVPPATEFVPGAFTPHDVMEEHEKDARQIAARAAERLTRSGLSVDTAVRQGDPRTVIVDEAENGEQIFVVGSTDTLAYAAVARQRGAACRRPCAMLS